eukprot:Protomagalhaensia_wolfi_Nauph_80__3109@NODE_317_length_2800_cov_20_693227_g239_i0_p3_GENE_NODE_317_length_2800_cov_20_693227_g239_i0NODE_317_length_2800_cov_20_693227_g239_i0_p3_ORF_typecomplete_len132_score18_42DLH/PF01738_18/2_2e08_NODE_317_length_2800_cov_20_693227_g239_i023042699
MTSLDLKERKEEGHKPVGIITTINDITLYKTGSDENGKFLIFCPDLFGMQAPNNQSLADRIAEAALCCVIIPDYFNGDPLPFHLSIKEILLQLPAFLQRHDMVRSTSSPLHPLPGGFHQDGAKPVRIIGKQ